MYIHGMRFHVTVKTLDDLYPLLVLGAQIEGLEARARKAPEGWVAQVWDVERDEEEWVSEPLAGPEGEQAAKEIAARKLLRLASVLAGAGGLTRDDMMRRGGRQVDAPPHRLGCDGQQDGGSRRPHVRCGGAVCDALGAPARCRRSETNRWN